MHKQQCVIKNHNIKNMQWNFSHILKVNKCGNVFFHIFLKVFFFFLQQIHVVMLPPPPYTMSFCEQPPYSYIDKRQQSVIDWMYWVTFCHP